MERPCFDLINSDWHDWRRPGVRADRLDNPGWVSRFLTDWGLDVGEPLAGEARARLGVLRSLLRRLVDDFRAGRPLDAADVAQLNTVLAAAPLRRRAEPKGGRCEGRFEPVTRDWDWVAAETAASFVKRVETGESGRLKVCENVDCLWVFYDDSRNRTRRWCDSRSCGNLIKVRRFRAKRRAERTP